LVDNGSTDESPAVIRDAFPDIDFVRIEKNCGFSMANNVGIKHALESGTSYIFLLNNDTVVDAGILKVFVEASSKLSDAGFLGAKIYYFSEPERIWAAMTRWDGESGSFQHVGNNEPDDPGEYGSVRETAYASGCALFFHADLVKRIGLMEPKFYCYFEEVDWCSRARNCGYRNYFIPGARVWHKVSAAYGGRNSPVVEYFRTRNTLLWARRNLPAVERRKVRRNVLKDVFADFSREALKKHDCLLPKAVYWRIMATRKDPSAMARLLGLRDYVLGRFGDCPVRVKDYLKNNREVFARICVKGPR
jgi:GT2 family glycosyltransferase